MKSDNTNQTATNPSPRKSKAVELGHTLGELLQDPAGSIWTNGAFADASILKLADGHCPEELQTIRSRLKAISKFDVLERIPILGVCGMIASGKSSLVASFLSADGANRPLIGDLDIGSTNRFTFWLPLSWKDDEIISRNLHEFIEATFGAPPELLSEDPGQAQAQQNARGSESKPVELGIPLLAFDQALDACGVAFLDCPDVQKSAQESILAPTADLRLKALRNGSRLCSGFVVVTTLSDAPTEVFGRILKTLESTGRDLPVYIALNMIPKRHDPTACLEQIRKIVDRWGMNSQVQMVFGARYQNTDETPRPDFRKLPDEELPLSAISENLDPSVLFGKALAGAYSEITRNIATLRDRLETQSKGQKSKVEKVQESVSDFLSAQLFDDEGSLRSFMPPHLAKQVMESFKRTAPIWMKPGFLFHKPVEIVVQGAAKGAQWILAQFPSNWLRTRLLNAKIKNPDALREIKPDAFISHMQGRSFTPPNVDSDKLRKVWASGLEAVADKHMSEVVSNRDNLDDHTRSVWSEVPLYKKAAFAATFPLALATTLLAVLFIPFDFGASAVMAASIGELMAAAGFGYLANVPAMAKLKSLLEKEVGIPQISDLHAALCDGFGVPRHKEPQLKHRATGKSIKLNKTSIAPQPPHLPCLDGGYFELNAKAFSEIQKKLDKLQPAEG
jgi:hypothetical protein